MSNKIVGELVNVVSFQTDKRSFDQVRKDMQRLATTWNQCANKMQTPSLEKMKQVSSQLRKQRDLLREIRATQNGLGTMGVPRVGGGRGQAGLPRRNGVNQTYTRLRKQAEQQRIMQARATRDSAKINSMFSPKTVDRYRQEISDLQARRPNMPAAEFNARMGKLMIDMRNHEKALINWDKVLNKTSGTLQKFNGGLNKVLKGMGIAASALGGMIYKAFQVSTQNNRAYYGLLAQNNDDKALTKSQMDFVGQMAEKYGLDLMSSQMGFMKFRGATKATMDESTARGLFEALTIKGTVSGTDAQGMSLALKALEQMSSKSLISMEELRQQMGDHIPGAVQDFYKAWQEATGKSEASFQDFQKAVKAGNVQLEKLAPSLIKIWSVAEGTEAFAQAMQQPEKELQRLKNTMDKAAISFMGVIDASDGVTSVSEALSYLFRDLRAAFAETDFKAIGEAVGEFLYQMQYKFWRFYFDFAEPFIQKLNEWLGETTQEKGQKLADIVEGILKVKAAVMGLSVLVGTIKAIYAFRKAILALKAAAALDSVTPGGKGGGFNWKMLFTTGATALGVSALSYAANAEREVVDNKLQEAKEADPKRGASYEFLEFLNNLGAVFTPGGNTAPLFNQVTGWFRSAPTINPQQAMPMPQMSPAFTQQAGVNPALSIHTQGELQGEINVKVDMMNQDVYVDQRIDAKLDDYDTRLLNQIAR